MRVLLSTARWRGDVEPLAGLTVALRVLGSQARVCAPPDEEFAGLPHMPECRRRRWAPQCGSAIAGQQPPSANAALRLAPELINAVNRQRPSVSV